MRDLLIDLFDAILFHPVLEEIFYHPVSVWMRSLPPWKRVLFCLSASTITALYVLVITLLPLQSPFWRFIARQWLGL